MRRIPRHRQDHKTIVPRISISQEEILADLLYPAGPRPRQESAARTRRR